MAFPLRILAFFGILFLCACSETQYAAHLAKQIPFPGDTPQSQGTFKVGKPYQAAGKWYYPEETYTFQETGIASWYGPGFHGKHTANGEVYDQNELTAAHKTLQLPCFVRVTNLENGRSVVVRVNDRGPFSRGRVIDVSERAASLLGFKGRGTAKVKIAVVGDASQKLAQAARSGADTRGTEIAMNQPQRQPVTPYQEASYQAQKSAAVSREPLPSSHYSSDGRIMPDPTVRQVPVSPTGIYVQAGSFGLEENALRLSQTLQDIGPARVYKADIRGRTFFRVRIGPFAEVAQADRALASLVSQGSGDAIIIVD